MRRGTTVVRIARGILVAAMLHAPLQLNAQRKIEISPLRTPPRSRVRFVERVRFAYELSTMGYPVWMTMDSRKRFYREDWPGNRVRVLDSMGKAITTIGRKGRGPGEFTNSPSPVIGVADTLYLSDGIKVEVYSPRYQRVRSSPVRGQRPARLQNGQLAYQTQTNEMPSGTTNFVTVYDSDGKQVQYFRIAPAAKAPNDLSHAARGVFGAPDNTVWITFFQQYELEQRDITGKLLTTISLIPEGEAFKDYHRQKTITGNAEEVSIDSESRAWVLCIIPNGKKRHEQAENGKGGAQDAEMDDYETILVVIDLKSGKLLAADRTPIVWPHFAAPGVLYAGNERENGESEVVVWDVSLTSKASGND